MNGEIHQVSVVGLGLMGGSLAAALAGSGRPWRVVGFDSHPPSLETALAEGYIHRAAATFEAALEGADVLVLAVPVRGILHYLGQLAAAVAALPPGAVVMDVGSTKAQIVGAMDLLPEGVAAIGGHPMCGKRTSGLDGASPEMYRGRVFLLSPTRRRPEAAEVRAREIVAAIGAKPMLLEAPLHDRLVAIVSHLPHFLAIPILEAAGSAEDDRVWRLAAGGFRSVTAGIQDNPAMWEDVLLTNRPGILRAARELSAALDGFASVLEEGDDGELLETLHRAMETYRRHLG